MKKLITSLTILSLILLIASNVFAITANITANGSDGAASVSSGSFTVSIGLDAAGNSSNADWWLVYNDGSNWYYYNLSGGWQAGFTVSYQGALRDLSSTDFSVTGLSSGSYTFYFGVDLVQNGEVNTGSGQIFYDSVVVTVAASGWSFTEDATMPGMSGVSPEAALLSDGSVRLYVTDIGDNVYKSTDGVTFTTETASLPLGSADHTLIELSDGTYRMYYVDSGNTAGTIWTATSPDGLTWTIESNTGITNVSSGQAWGVPDSVETPDGRIRLYWVDMPTNGNYEVIKSAISTDGTTFTEESGYRTEDGYVDSYVMIAENGNWVALFSTTPATERLPQKIYIGTSTDGLTWSIDTDPIITVPGGNALDPTAVPLGDGSYRVYYSSTPTTDVSASYSIKSGVLRPQ